MADGSAALDLLLRGGACAVLALVIAVVIRDHRRRVVAQLAAGFAAGGIAYAIAGIPGFSHGVGPWAIPLVMVATGNNLVFWLLARRLFDDGFRVRPWHGAVWLGIVALQAANQLGLPQAAGVGGCVSLVLIGQAPVFAILATVQTVATWRDDLVERRRRLRVVVVCACTLYIVLSIAPDIAGTARDVMDAPNLALAAGLLAVAMVVASLLLAVRPAVFEAPAAVSATASLTPDDQRLLARLDGLMTLDRAYRQDGLTVAALAQRLDIPEYRLRRLINHGLGHRNFAAFINGWRIRDACQALEDPAQDAVPILTIALDAGFASLGPFNRAFKGQTGVTPSDYRARRSSQTAGRISRSA